MPELATSIDLTRADATRLDAAVGTLRPAPRIHFGAGARHQLPDLVHVHGRRVLVVADPFLAGHPTFTDVLRTLTDAGLEVEVVDDVVPELPVATLDALADRARSHRADVVVGFGGGSALDAAKLVALLLAHGGPLHRFYGENQVPGPTVPVVALPTTAGTGSEVTPVAVVSDPERALKVGISSPFLVPVAAVVDPELTLGAPASVTAFSGVDAIVHAVESYTARSLPLDWSAVPPVFTGRNVLSDPLALEAARRLGPWLTVAVRTPTDVRARTEVALGSLLAGLAFGSTGTHLSHAIQYPLGAMTKTPHGLGTGLMLPYVLDVLRADPDVADRLVSVHVALSGCPVEHASAEGLVRHLADLNRDIGVPASLADVGLDRGELPKVAELTLASGRLVAIAPVDVTLELVTEILRRAHAGHLSARSTS